ncbi:hypothetical protein MON38_17170 [Hymenobacter sp. DH14]|uniref:Uncharacterized protein n=1 Tax=Hymenobacter cyanobacteriorum TaxID=2926463 RepID=A0A9X2AGS7_9BACT|nr:hypothetical protein [Hymenobacter cyanobacteriorum]MCI1189157.1 hypothetical protein [Hymenobacter cyanobacteriorum]
MNLTFPLLFGLLAAGPPPPPAPPAAPVRTLELAKGEMLHATITLPNHNTLLFIPALRKSTVRVVALQPDGAPAWETTLQKAQVMRTSAMSVLSSNMPPEESLITTMPLFLTSAENTVYTVEPISDGAPEQGVPRNALVVQALSPTGDTRGKVFTVPEVSAKTGRAVITVFAEPGVVYVLARESSIREKTSQLYLDRCDLATGKLTQLALNLPPAAKPQHAEDFYLDWVFAGFRAGTCHFYRALRGADAKADARRTPVEFEVLRVAVADGHALGGFTTRLHQNLPEAHYLQGGVYLPHTGIACAPPTLDAAGKTVSLNRTLNLETGGDCEVLLDEATGDYVFAGSYTNHVASLGGNGLPGLGTFAQRYAADGTLLKASIAPYAGVRGYDEEQLRPRSVMLVRIPGMLLPSPFTQELSFGFSTRDGDLMTSSFDAQLKTSPPQLLSFEGHKNYRDPVFFSGPTYLESPDNTTGDAQRHLLVGGLLASSSEMYRKIGQVAEDYATDKAHKSRMFYQYTASATGPASALVIVQPYEQGRAIDIYRVQ